MTSNIRISAVAVVGSGYMGGGIAQVLAGGGFRVVLADVDARTAENARSRLTDQADMFETHGLLPVGASSTIRKNLYSAESIEDAVSEADYITEAVPEDLELKLHILGRISLAAGSNSIIGTNTSAIPIKRLAEGVANPERFLGVHWMNPAPFVPGVELIRGPLTTTGTIDVTESLIRKVGKTPARVSDSPGFVANRLQFALFKEAVRIVEEGLATPDQIDSVVSTTFGFRLALFGPFAIGDMAGLDVYDSSYKTLEEAYGERFSSPQSLAEMVGQGNLGLKSGAGFLGIKASDRNALLEYRDNAYARLSQLREQLGKAPGL